jgi:hypothetical protein
MSALQAKHQHVFVNVQRPIQDAWETAQERLQERVTAAMMYVYQLVTKSRIGRLNAF